ncbi:MAG TPA: OmpA family protein, partial [Hyphomicrobium sp.]|nr:OmpA family protein [Hyphomicrobium sp.]
MIHFRAPLLGGVCCIGLMFQFASVDIVHAATTVEMPGARDAALTPTVESAMPALLADEATINYGYETAEDAMETAEDDSASPESPAWAAPAKMNPDYATDESAAPAAPSESNTEAAPTQTAEEAAPPPTGGQATTEYYGNSQTPNNPAWAAPAAMNPDYTNEPAAPAEQAQPAATEAPAQTAEEAAPPPTGGQATTEYYGNSQTANNPAWAAPAAMNPDYTNEPAAPAEQAQPAATEAPAQTAEEAAPPPTGGQATTEYYGNSQTANNPAWAAPAAMNP